MQLIDPRTGNVIKQPLSHPGGHRNLHFDIQSLTILINGPNKI